MDVGTSAYFVAKIDHRVRNRCSEHFEEIMCYTSLCNKQSIEEKILSSLIFNIFLQDEESEICFSYDPFALFSKLFFLASSTYGVEDCFFLNEHL